MCLRRHEIGLHVGGAIIIRSCRRWGGEMLVEVHREEKQYVNLLRSTELGCQCSVSSTALTMSCQVERLVLHAPRFSNGQVKPKHWWAGPSIYCEGCWGGGA